MKIKQSGIKIYKIYAHSLLLNESKDPIKKHRYTIINNSETFQPTIDLPQLKFITEFS